MTLIFLFFLWLVFLKIFTLHNIHIKVPNYIGESVFKIDSISMKNNLRYVILDSIYDINRKKGVVVSQDPLPDMNVKKNRRIYLTVNSLQSKKISFPDIYDLSLRQAINKLENIGIEIGDLDYVPDIALNKIHPLYMCAVRMKALKIWHKNFASQLTLYLSQIEGKA